LTYLSVIIWHHRVVYQIHEQQNISNKKKCFPNPHSDWMGKKDKEACFLLEHYIHCVIPRRSYERRLDTIVYFSLDRGTLQNLYLEHVDLINCPWTHRSSKIM